ncbi:MULTISPECIES: hypothetical protein [Clostridium]|uniref:Uncharacterized protein n=1 Tax=Clostridium sporogenes TaxID=1509 RepID=A0A1L3ND38_CLOSG|nr:MULTISPECIES: hypothetical protein [Clostridium]APH14027.1 hypothetical protein NPD5_3917 [Clostridium sporogenes]MBD5639472.1 hypothetical protein [Clostridium botulinum]MDI6918982.1 hypothetical protein [Clostridium botulinum]WMU99800.1 hypothetical protein QA656_19395 [Clostridium botulinum]BDB03600.1 hypothetical protein CBOS2020_36740 [Clostridium botulinum]
MKTIIIGNVGSGAYIFFRYLIFKEESKNFLVVDEIGNKELIELQNNNSFKSLFYNYDKNFQGITYKDIKEYKVDKVYINTPNKFEIDYNWLLEENDDILRVSINDLTLELKKHLNKFHNVFIFNPCNKTDKNYLANSFSLYYEEILSFSDNRKDEYIAINKGAIKHSILKLDKNFKIGLDD